MTGTYRIVIRTPHEVIIDAAVRAARLPTETGQVGLRPQVEPMLLVIEAGLMLLRGDDVPGFAASAGGLFEGDRKGGVLYTPFAVAGHTADEVLAALDRASATPSGEIALRRQIGELEQRIVEQLRERSARRPNERRP